MRPKQRLTGLARELRRDATFAEVRLWALLRSSKLAGFKFRRQHPIPPYVADFCCVAAKVIVELDGDAHLGQEEHDRTREAYLRQQGFEVVRFWNSDVFAEENRVIETVLRLCRQRTDAPGARPPSPLPLSPRKAGGRGDRHETMTLTVHLFAAARELAGTDAVAVVLPPAATVADLRAALRAAAPALAGLLARSAVAVNHDFADDARALAPADEVAVIPPVSGG